MLYSWKSWCPEGGNQYAMSITKQPHTDLPVHQSCLVCGCTKASRWISYAGRDQPFVNNYGVWTDEYSELGLEDTLDAKWNDALCYFGEGKEVRVGRRCRESKPCFSHLDEGMPL